MQYHDPVINYIALGLQYIIQTSALAVNGSLVLLILLVRRRELGSYRYLLLCFAISDFYYTLLHYLTYPIPEMWRNAFVVRGHGVLSDPFWMSLYLGAYGHCFPLLVFHFFYRVIAVKCPQYLSYFWLLLTGLIVTLCSNSFLWFSVYYWVYTSHDADSIEYLKDLFDGTDYSPIIHTPENAKYYVHAVYWLDGTFETPKIRNIVGTVTLAGVMLTAYAIIFACSYQIMRFLSNKHMSAKTLKLQRQLFRCLVYQTVVPFITAYCPAGMCMTFPIVGLSFSVIAVLCPPFCAIHPLFDALVIIFTISEYRRALFAAMLSPFKKRLSAPVQRITTQTLAMDNGSMTHAARSS